MHCCFVALVASVLLVNPQKTSEKRPVGKSELEGEWALVVWDCDGHWFTAQEDPIGDHYRDLRFTFTADRIKIKLRENGQRIRLGWDGADWPYEIDPTKTPKEIDSEGGGPGIYSLRRDRLVICWNRGGNKRPDKFEIKPKRADTLLLLERVKK
jgi:uncharacterized protein (TIGR03067 family)